MGYRLGIDVGDPETAWATVAGSDRAAVGGATVPTSVVLTTEGTLLAGDDVAAVPSDQVRHLSGPFAARLGDAAPVMLGTTPYGAEALVGHLVASIVRAVTADGDTPDAVALAHADGLDDYRIGLLAEAARLSGIALDRVELVARAEALAALEASGWSVAHEVQVATGAALVAQLRRQPAAPSESGGLGTVAALGGGAAAGAVGGVLGASTVGEAAAGASAAAPAAYAGAPLAAPGGAYTGAPLAAPGGAYTGAPLAAPAGGYTGAPLAAPGGGYAGAPLAAPGGAYTGAPLSPPAPPPAGTGGPEPEPDRRPPRLRPKRLPIIVAAGAAVVVLGGTAAAVLTGGSDAPAGAVTTTAAPAPLAGPTSTVVRTTPATTDAPTTTPAVTDAPTTAAATTAPPTTAASAAACTVGHWLADMGVLRDIWGAGFVQALPGTVVTGVTGALDITITADGTFTADYQALTTTASAAGGEGSLQIEGNGVDVAKGDFRPDGTVTFTDISSGAKIVTTAQVGGVQVPIPPSPVGGTLFSTSSSYTCSGGTMSITTTAFNSKPIVMNRVP